MDSSVITLRPYQKKFIADVRAEFSKGCKRICGVAPCGAGKTVMTGWMIKEAVNRGNRSIFFVHRKELIEQTAQTFSTLQIPFGIIAAGHKPNYNLPVQIASVQTLVNRLDNLPQPNFLICDECHHILAKTYLKIINHWKDSFLLGVTATPERLGGVRLGDIFQSMVQAPTVKELIQLGNLTDFTYYAPPSNLNFKKLKLVHGDYQIDQAAHMMQDSKVVHDVIGNYQKFAKGKSCICYCVNVEHSKITADAFNQAGIPAAQCDGETPKDERAAIVNNFRKGNIKVLCNAELFGEGFDVPNMDAVILARPTKSLTLHIQQSMRPMRPDKNNPSKKAVILDCVDRNLGLPDDPRCWSLDPNKEKEEPQHPPMKICPECQAVIPAGCRVCTNCGYEFEYSNWINGDAELSEVLHGLNHFLQLAEQHGYKKGWAVFKAMELATSYDDFLSIAQAMHYKKGWAWHKWQEFKEIQST